MPRILAIDYGLQRVGLAVTDPLQIIATPLETVACLDLLSFLMRYLAREAVEAFVVGWPRHLDGKQSEMTQEISRFGSLLEKTFPNQKVFYYDERFTSKLAMRGMVEGGFKRKDRRDKANLDQRSATILLQSFLARRQRIPS